MYCQDNDLENDKEMLSDAGVNFAFSRSDFNRMGGDGVSGGYDGL